MDHYAQPGDELSVALDERRLSRNFQGYTVRQSDALIGFGVTAISDVAGAYAQNEPTIEDYFRAACTNGLATYRGVATTGEDRLRRHVIQELMCNLYLDIPRVEEKFDIDFWRFFSVERERLSALEKDGLVAVQPTLIEVTNQGRILVRQIGAVFDAFLHREKADRPRYSRGL